MGETTYKVGDWTIQPDLNLISNEQKEIILEPRVLALLDYFASNQGRVLSRDELTDKVWQSLIVNDNTINYTIGMLRRALGDKARNPQYIQTVAKKGYRLIADVGPADAANTAKETAPKETPDTLSPPSTFGQTATLGKKSRFTLPAAMAVASLILMGTYFFRQPEPLLYTETTPFTTLLGEEFGVIEGPHNEWVYFAHKPKGAPFGDLYRQRLSGGLPELAMPATPNQHETSPALSPDGTKLAFARFHDDGCVMFLYQMGTNTEAEKLTKCGPYYPGLKWVSNHELIYVAADNEKDLGPLRRLDIRNQDIAAVSSPPAGQYDIVMALSQDGSQAAFFRTSDWKHSDLYTIDLKTGEETYLGSYSRLIWALAWTNNDQSLVYVPDADMRRLEAMNIKTRKKTTAYQQKVGFLLESSLQHSNTIFINERDWDNNIHIIPLKSPVSALKNMPNQAILASTKSEWLPKETNDGKFIGFLSERTGNAEIWMADKNGENQRQISNFAGAFSVEAYSWNNAGDTIAFQTYDDTIYLLDVATGAHRKAAAPEGYAKLPVFTPSDQHIVFTAKQGKSWQLWQTPITGGTPEQITTNGGYSARFNKSGDMIFTKHATGGLWQFDFETRVDREIAPDVTVYPIRQWVLRESGAYYTKDYEGRAQVFFYDWETKKSQRLFDTPHWRYTFEISADEKDIYFTRDESKGGDILMLK